MTVFIILMKIRTFDHSHHRVIIINFNGLRFNSIFFFPTFESERVIPNLKGFFFHFRALFFFSNLGNVSSFPSTSQVNDNVRGVVF